MKKTSLKKDEKFKGDICDRVFFSTIKVNKKGKVFQDFFRQYHQICKKLRIWSHLLKKSLMENVTFWAVPVNFESSNFLEQPLTAVSDFIKRVQSQQ